jgi:hypothetical protein
MKGARNAETELQIRKTPKRDRKAEEKGREVEAQRGKEERGSRNYERTKGREIGHGAGIAFNFPLAVTSPPRAGFVFRESPI